MCEIFHPDVIVISLNGIRHYCLIKLQDAQADRRIYAFYSPTSILPPLNETASKQAITTTLQRNTDTPRCLFQALMSRRTTRQPHPRMLPFVYAPRLRLHPRFVVALVLHSGKQVYVCLARRSTVRSQMRWRCSIRASARCSSANSTV